MTATLFDRQEESDALERPLRPHQSLGLDELRGSFAAGNKHVVLHLPTGGGKTRMAAEIINSALPKGRRIAFCVPAVALVDQTVEEFGKDGVLEMGVIQRQHYMTDWSKPVQVCSVQTLMRRPYPDVNFVLIDEVHEQFEFYHRWMREWPHIPFIGFSATPWARGMGLHWQDLIIVSTTRELIEQGYLSPFRVYAPSHPDLKGVKIQAGDYHEGQLADRMNKPQLVADIVETWIELGENLPTFFFGVDCAHAKAVQEKFLAAGIPWAYQDAYTTDDERRSIKRAFHSGDIKGVSNVGTLVRGVDWDVRCLILGCPTRSEMKFVQIFGRMLRTAPGKQVAICIDHADNHLRLGFVTDIHHDKLNTSVKGDAAEKKPKEALPKECPKCHALRSPKVNKCPVCGFVAEKKSNVETLDGKLVEITPGAKKASEGIKLGRVTLSENEFYRQLRWIANEKGWNPKWAANQFRDKFDRWPPFAWNDETMLEPIAECRSWVRARLIRYAKGKAKAAANAPAV